MVSGNRGIASFEPAVRPAEADLGSAALNPLFLRTQSQARSPRRRGLFSMRDSRSKADFVPGHAASVLDVHLSARLFVLRTLQGRNSCAGLSSSCL